MRILYLVLFSMLFLFSCNSVKRTQKLLSHGDYDKAISLAVKKLQKDKNAKEYDAHIAILENAYKKAEEEDIKRIALLKKQNSRVGKREIYHMYTNLISRQNLIRPLLPLYSKEMRRNGKFHFVDYGSDFVRAREVFVKSLYEQAQELLSGHSKEDARNAYTVLSELEEIIPHYKNVSQLMDDAHFRGTDFVFVQLQNHTRQFIPLRLQRDLLNFNTYGLNDFWTEYHSQIENGIQYDFEIDLNFQTIEISPERIIEKQYTLKEKIKDGSDYQRDRRGNIVRDSLGNPRKTERTIVVSAKLNTTTQQKSVFIGGTVLYKDLNQNRQIRSYPLSTEFIFENIFATYQGDKRALGPEDLRLVSNVFRPFPNTEQMIFDAGQELKDRFREVLISNSFE